MSANLRWRLIGGGAAIGEIFTGPPKSKEQKMWALALIAVALAGAGPPGGGSTPSSTG